MENFLFTVNAVLPLFVIIAAGWLCQRKRLIVEDNIRFINRLCFRVLFPCIGFSSGYSSTLSFSDFRLIGFSLGAYAASFAILLLAVPHFVRSREQACVVIHAGFRSNIVLFGIGMAYNLFGEAGAGPSILTVATMVPLGNVMSVLLMKIYDRGEGEPVNAASVIRSVATHPLIIAALLGILCSLSGVVLPTIIIEPIRDLAGAAAPIAMLGLGARLNFRSAAEHRRLLAAGCVIKLILLPAAAVAAGWLLGFRQYELGAVFIDFAMPTASVVAIMADSEGGDAALAGEMVVFTSAFSCFTLFAGVYLMRSIGLF